MKTAKSYLNLPDLLLFSFAMYRGVLQSLIINHCLFLFTDFGFCCELIIIETRGNDVTSPSSLCSLVNDLEAGNDKSDKQVEMERDASCRECHSNMSNRKQQTNYLSTGGEQTTNKELPTIREDNYKDNCDIVPKQEYISHGMCQKIVNLLTDVQKEIHALKEDNKKHAIEMKKSLEHHRCFCKSYTDGEVRGLESRLHGLAAVVEHVQKRCMEAEILRDGLQQDVVMECSASQSPMSTDTEDTYERKPSPLDKVDANQGTCTCTTVAFNPNLHGY